MTKIIRPYCGNGLFTPGAAREEEHTKHSGADARLSRHSNGHTLRVGFSLSSCSSSREGTRAHLYSENLVYLLNLCLANGMKAKAEGTPEASSRKREEYDVGRVADLLWFSETQS